MGVCGIATMYFILLFDLRGEFPEDFVESYQAIIGLVVVVLCQTNVWCNLFSK